MNSKELAAEVEFTYHNVGQGLFYSGEINLLKVNKNAFRFVYDCGSENKKLINTAVHRFKQDVTSNEIDLLIISHLHSDHVSGLEELFKNFRIREVILPYFSPKDRLLISLRRTNVSQWYYNFLSDPIKYLFERGVKRVIIIGGEEGGEGNAPPEDIHPEGPFPEEKLDIRLPDDERLKEEIGTVQQDGNSGNEGWGEYIKKGRLLIKSHNGYIYALGLWVFRFFNYKISPSKLSEFDKCIGNSVLKATNKDIRELIKNRKQLKNLKRCYDNIKKDLRNDFNNTSLVLYHGPVGEKENFIKCLSLSTCRFCVPWTDSCCVYNFGQFLTGDISLNMRYNELINHYKPYYLERVLITQVPHHGAKKNWNRDIISNSEFWVISAGLRNRYGHPSCEVVSDIYLNGEKCIWVNEVNCMKVKGEVIW